jgi:hypothetical protein
MPVIQSQEVGYYNYYDISSRYKCETPYVNWYNRDLRNALYQKYGDFEPYSNYSKDE